MARTKGSTSARSLSRYGEEALVLLGQLIRAGRIKRKLSVQDLAERVGVSRDMIRRVESGDPRCGIGSVFEAATIVGVPLFEADESRLSMRVAEQAEKLQLMPKAVHETRTVVRDDF